VEIESAFPEMVVCARVNVERRIIESRLRRKRYTGLNLVAKFGRMKKSCYITHALWIKVTYHLFDFLSS
jgi:hypothetical protein